MTNNQLTPILARTASAASLSDKLDENNLSRLLYGTANSLLDRPTDLTDREVDQWTRWAKVVQHRNPDRLTDGELLDLAVRERRSSIRLDVYDLSGLGTWKSAQTSTPPPLWGDGETSLVPAKGGRPTLVYGDDGAGKTNLVGLYVCHSLGILKGPLLGYNVEPLDESDSVLVLAFDGPQETRQSYARFGLDATVDRLVVWGASAPWNPDDADASTLETFVSAIEEATGQTFGLIVIDNAQRAYGAVDQATRASALGTGLNRLEASGRSVVVLAQSRKNGKPTSKDDAMLGSLGLSGMGSILSLHRLKQGATDGTRPTTSELRHHKGLGSDSEAKTVVSFDLVTGRATLEGEGPSDELRSRVVALPEVGTFTAKDAASVWDVGIKQARKLVTEAASYELLELDHEGERGAKHWRRTT